MPGRQWVDWEKTLVNNNGPHFLTVLIFIVYVLVAEQGRTGSEGSIFQLDSIDWL